MSRYIILWILVFQTVASQAQTIHQVNAESFKDKNPVHQYFINIAQIKKELDYKGYKKNLIQLHDNNGNAIDYFAEYVPLLSQEYESTYDIHSYRLKPVDPSKYGSGRLCITPKGLSAIIFTDGHTLCIESDAIGNTRAFKYTKDENQGHKYCGTIGEEDGHERHSPSGTVRTGETLKTFQIAVACTGEFSNKRSNNLTVINADIASYLSALNALYEVEFSVNFMLAANNNNIIFFDPATDGLDPANPITTAQSVIGSIMPTSTYDVGHVLHEITVSGGGYTYSGIAGVGVICSTAGNSKAAGWTGIGGAYNVSIVLEVFGHEVGHQFGANHTFYGTATNCSGSQRKPGHGYEPGSGNSMMSYEGNCGSTAPCNSNQNITPYVNSFYFNAHSIDEILTKLSSVSCHSATSTGNNDPVATVGATLSIPKNTAFMLTGSATDANGDALSYNWEEYDTDNLSLTCPAGAPNDAANSTTAPCFRSFDPGADKNKRSFPKSSDILNNTQTMGEILPAVARTMKFRMSVRDGNGGVAYGEQTVNIINTSGAFAISSHNTSTTLTGGQSVTVTWSVNGTTSSPISCANVKILFSLDGGVTFPIVLINSTSNDGSESIVVPNFSTTKGRIKVEAVGNIFFDINNANLTVTSTCSPGTSDIINTDSVIANPGDAILDLTPIKGVIMNSIDGILESTDPSINITGKNLSNNNACITFGSSKNYDLVTFKVSKTGNYTFAINTTYIGVINLYSPSFSTSNGCTNWLNSSMEATLVSGSSYNLNFLTSITVSLTAGTTYVMQITNWNGLGAYSITYTNSLNGKVYSDTNVPPSGFSYTYVIEKISTGNITAIDASANLSNAAIFTSGDYKVWGLAFTTGTSLTSYVGGPFSALTTAIYGSTFCGFLSTNFIPVKIKACVPSTKTVTSAADTNTPGTLRYLLTNLCPGDIIIFDAALTNINVGSPIVIDKTNGVVNGPGKTFVLSGSNTNRIFDVNAGIAFEVKNIALKNAVSSTNGGAIYNQGTLTLDNVLLQNNKQGTVQKAFTSTGPVTIKGATDIKL